MRPNDSAYRWEHDNTLFGFMWKGEVSLLAFGGLCNVELLSIKMPFLSQAVLKLSVN
jgi:hypothetical protein